jgi:hypothetical protein
MGPFGRTHIICLLHIHFGYKFPHLQSSSEYFPKLKVLGLSCPFRKRLWHGRNFGTALLPRVVLKIDKGFDLLFKKMYVRNLLGIILGIMFGKLIESKLMPKKNNVI